MVGFGTSKDDRKNHEEVADIPPHLSDLHCVCYAKINTPSSYTNMM